MLRRLIWICALALLALPLCAAPSETLYGMLVSISPSDLTLDTGEDHPIHTQINGATKYLSTMGKVKASDFEPGDKITVEASRSDGDRYLSTAITLNKKGTAHDKETAKAALNPPVALSPAPPAQAISDSAPVLRRGDAPSAPPAPSPLPAQSSPSAQRPVPASDDIIAQAREVATGFTETLPNYVTKRFTTRYISRADDHGRTPWQSQDVVTVDLVFVDGKENYTNMMINGRENKGASKQGSWSEGEFASTLAALMSPYSATDFRNRRDVIIARRPAFRYDYSIDQPRSTWRIETQGQAYQPGYEGSIWIDKETFRVLRIEMSARNLPRSFPIDTTESSLDYDFVSIGDQKFLLPVHSESLNCWRETGQCSRNVTDFRDYRKYSADSSITFDGAVPAK